MRVTNKTSRDEQTVLTGMIVDNAVCGRLAGKWQPTGLFRNRWANLVAEWCVGYYRDYGAAPKAHIEGLFESWAEGHHDQGTIDLVDKFLGSLSGEYDPGNINSDYITDVAGEHLNRVRIEQLNEAIRGDIDSGQLDKATKRIGEWGRIELGAGSWVDVLGDDTAIRDAFQHKSDPLVVYPGALGEFFGDSMERDAFVGFLGATGRGKTWWLMDVAWRALRQRRRVAFYQVGDLSQAQMMRRFMVRASNHPLKPGKVLKPVSIDRGPQDEIAVVEHEELEFATGLDVGQAIKDAKKRNKLRPGLLRLVTHPNSSVTVDGIRDELAGWEREGWVPDVVVVDYADILAPPYGGMDSRDAINANWKALRRLSQVLHCCVVTATQSDAGSYTAHTLRRGNFSDDRRKLDHVTGMVGLNATEAEKAMGVYRLNWLKLRDDEYAETRCVHVAGTLALGNPAMRSCK